MFFKTIVLISAVCLSSLFSGARAQEKVDFTKSGQHQLSYNFGQAREGDVVRCSFKILNNSQSAWRIESVMPSCECVSAKLVGAGKGAEIVNPDEVFQIEIRVDTADYAGVMEQFVYVSIIENDERKILKLIIEGKVTQNDVSNNQSSLLKNQT